MPCWHILRKSAGYSEGHDGTGSDEKTVDFVVRVKTSGLTIEQIKPQIADVVTDFMNRLEPGRN